MRARLFSLGTAVVNAVPAPVRYGAARALGVAAYTLGADLGRQARENYAAILEASADAPRVRQVAREAVVGYVKLMADFLWLPALTPERIREVVQVTGLSNLQGALTGGRGAIVVTPHFGNWDMAAAAAVAHGVKLTAVTDRYGDSEMDRKVVAAREKFGMKVVPVGVGAGRAVISALRRNEVVALVCDLPKEDARNVAVNLLGQPALVPAGPAVLALRTGAPLVPITCRRLPDNRYRLDIEDEVQFTPTGREADVPALAQAIVDRFAATLRALPEQWYLFSRMWGLVDDRSLVVGADTREGGARGAGGAGAVVAG